MVINSSDYYYLLEMLRALTVFLDGLEIMAIGDESKVANGTELRPCNYKYTSK
jgi:hypothetical protein